MFNYVKISVKRPPQIFNVEHTVLYNMSGRQECLIWQIWINFTRTWLHFKSKGSKLENEARNAEIGPRDKNWIYKNSFRL